MGAICMHIDGVYRWYIHIYWLCIWVLYTCILIVCMGGMYMYIHSTHIHNQHTCIYHPICTINIHVYRTHICNQYTYTCILMVYMGPTYMYINSAYGCYIHVYWLCIWVLCTCILMVYMGAMYMYIDGHHYTCKYHPCTPSIYMYIALLHTINIYVRSTHIYNHYTCIDCIYRFSLHVNWLCISMLWTCILRACMGVIYMYIDGIYMFRALIYTINLHVSSTDIYNQYTCI
jgi:hypothetical protein